VKGVRRVPHPLSFREFRLFWVTRLCSTLAQNSMIVVLGWQVYAIARHSRGVKAASFQLGLIGLFQFLPLFVLALVTGWVADYVDRRIVARACLGLQLGCAVLLALLSSAHVDVLLPFFVVAVGLGVGRAFSQPTLNAMAPQLVPIEILPRAIALNQIASRCGAIVGPAMGGYLYAVSPMMPYAASGVLFLVSLTALMLLRPLPAVSADRTLSPWRQAIEGLAYVRGNRLLLGAISLDLFAVLLGGATAMLPVFAYDILHVGAAGLGPLRAAPALGALGTALVFSQRPLGRRAGVKMLVAVAIYGIATAGFGLSRSMPLSLACLVVLGAADMLSVYVRQSLIQLSTPDAMRGRVGAVSTLFVSASNELGEAESGFLAALVGPIVAVVGGGIAAVAISLLWSRLFPALRDADGLS
jgi:MFS family permease